MGFARTLGRDYGTPRSKELLALECFFYWLVGGLILCFVLSALIFPKPNFIVPISVYIIGVVLLLIIYIKIEQSYLKNGKRK